MMVQAMEAFKSPFVAEWSMSAKTKVSAYMAKSRNAPNAAKIRLILPDFLFFMRIILYILIRL